MNFSEEIKKNEVQFLLIFLAGLALALASFLHYSIEWIPLNYGFGLLQLLPFSFWIGLAIMAISCLVGTKIDSEKIFLIKAFLLFFIVWTVPVFFEQNASTWDSFVHFNNAKRISESDYWKSIGTGDYLSWPGSFLYNYNLFVLTGLNAESFIKYYPFFSVALTFLAFAVFTRKLLPKNYRLALFLLIFFPAWLTFHLSPQSLGLPFLLFALSTLFCKKNLFWVIGFLFGVWLLVSHPTTMATALAIVTMWAIMNFISGLFTKKAENEKTAQPVFTIILVVVFFASVFLLNDYIVGVVNLKSIPLFALLDANAEKSIKSIGFINGVLEKAFADIDSTKEADLGSILYFKRIEPKLGLDSQLFLQQKPGEPPLETRDMNVVLQKIVAGVPLEKKISIEPILSTAPKIRLFSIVVLAMIAGAYLLFRFVSKQKDDRKNYLFFIACYITIFLMVDFGLLFFNVFLQFTDRILVYSSIFFVLMAVSLYSILPPKPAKALLAILFCFAFLNFLTAYYGESLYVIGNQIEDATVFVDKFASNDAKIWGGRMPYLQKAKQEYRDRSYVDQWDYTWIPAHWENWLVFSDHDLVWDRRWLPMGREREKNLDYSNTKNKLFENQRAQVFYLPRKQ